MAAPFRHVTIVGTGLIGGSFALALRKYYPSCKVVGWDKPDVLIDAFGRGAIEEGIPNFSEAFHGADLIYLALPVGHSIELLPEIARLAPPNSLVTDACSTKRSIYEVAAESFRDSSAIFLAGHPMAGKETSGIYAAAPNLFSGAKYALIGDPAGENFSIDKNPLVVAFLRVIKKFGAEPIWLDAKAHDRAAAVISHLPQLLAVALAGVVRNQTDETGLPLTLAGRGLRDALRLAGSPYSVWRDIILTNSDNLERVLDLMIQSLEQIRGELRTRALEEEFSAAGELYKILRDMQ